VLKISNRLSYKKYYLTMEGPALKRPKLQIGDVKEDDWFRWSTNLETLQTNLLSGCLCSVETLELQRPILPADGELPIFQSTSTSSPLLNLDLRFLKDYTLHFISTINLLSETALKQQTKGFMCKKIMDMASGVAMDEGIWEMLIEYLDSPDNFITFATSKCLVSLLMWTKLPNLNEIFDELFKSAMITTNNPIKVSHILEIIRGVVEYRDEIEHPLDLEDDDDTATTTADCTSNPDNIMSVDDDQSSDSDSCNFRLRNVNPTSASIKNCVKVEVDTEIESEVKTLCVKALENWWGRLLIKFQNMMASYSAVDEAPISTFLSLWLSIISVKNNLSVIDTKHYYMHLNAFVPLLNPNSPPILWKKLIDVFNEILCYGSTLSLQDYPNDEPCDLAHLLIRCVKSRQFLDGVPYSRHFYGFGGSSYGSVDWEWESGPSSCYSNISSNIKPNNTSNVPGSSKFSGKRVSLTPARRLVSHHSSSSSAAATSTPVPSSSKSFLLSNSLTPTASHVSGTSSLAKSSFIRDCTPSITNNLFGSQDTSSSSSSSLSVPVPGTSSSPGSFCSNNPMQITQIFHIVPRTDAPTLDESLNDAFGDKPLLQKVILLVLKSVAVTVKETRSDDSSDSDGGSMNDNSGSESDTNDMMIIEKLIREVFKHIDDFVKSLQPFHPETPMGEWMVKLFADQDDALIEAMLCVLDTFTGFQGRIDNNHEFHRTLNPVRTFVTFLRTISNDKDILMDWLMGNETCFLLYLLRFLKFSFRNWSIFVSSCANELDSTMSVLIRLRMGVGRLVERSLFPYNINPVLRLLERCEELYETKGNGSTSSTSSSNGSSSSSRSNAINS